MTNYTGGPWRYELRDLEGTVLGEAEARTLSEGDLCVTLSQGEAEKAILLVEARQDGTFQVRILSPDAALLHEQIVGEPTKPAKYDWGYHGSDTSHVHVSRGGDLFDVALYDRTVIDEKTGVDGEEQSLRDLRQLIGLANAAVEAGLDPLPVPDKT